jgi:putative transposase
MKGSVGGESGSDRPVAHMGPALPGVSGKVQSEKKQPMMRTIRRYSLPLNTGKWQALVDLVRRYAQEKDTHLIMFGQDAQFATCESERMQHKTLMIENYQSPNGLQQRAWKIAVKDAFETVERNWAKLAVELRSRVREHTQWNEQQRHYAYWLLQKPQRLVQLISGQAPIPTHFEIGHNPRNTVVNYLRRVVRRQRGERSRVHMARSMPLDPAMYGICEHNGVQYIKVSSLTPYKRIAIPLTGNTPIRGNIRMILDKERQRVEIHYTAVVKPATPLKGEPCGLDAGVSEVFTDEQGARYSVQFGTMLKRASDELNDRGCKRNKLHQVAKKADECGDRAKAGRLRKFNLGRKKLHSTTRRRRAEVDRQINTATREVLGTRKPAMIITERLDIRGKAKSKKLSRRVNLWARRTLNERVDFLASAGGSCRKQVNPAYSSQTCPACGYVHRDNRRGDAFQCQHCGHADDADRVAAHNLKARYGDAQIFLWTPKERVKAILLDRFNARLETS